MHDSRSQVSQSVRAGLQGPRARCWGSEPWPQAEQLEGMCVPTRVRVCACIRVCTCVSVHLWGWGWGWAWSGRVTQRWRYWGQRGVKCGTGDTVLGGLAIVLWGTGRQGDNFSGTVYGGEGVLGSTLGAV